MADHINAVLRQAILSLCKANYTDKIEVDGIICISNLGSKDQHVVKIHQQVDPVHQSAITSQSVVESALALSLGLGTSKSTEDTNRQMSSSPLSTEGSAKKTPKGKKRLRKSANDDPDFRLHKDPKISTSDGSDKPEHERVKKLRQSTKKIRVSYAEPSPENSDESDISDGASESSNVTDRYGIRERTPGMEKNVSLGSASVLLKLLADPRAKKMGNQKSMIDSVMRGTGILSGLRQEVSQAPPTQVGSGTLQSHMMHLAPQEPANTHSDMLSEYVEVKEEPEWDSEYGNTQDSNSRDQVVNGKEDTAMNDSESKTYSDETVEKGNVADSSELLTRIKEEPQWEGDVGENTMEDNSAKTDEKAGKTSEGNPPQSDSRKSILMNILKGPTLMESFMSKQKPSVYIDNGDEQNMDGKEAKGTEQDSSLLYRLPYASFSELLFPHNPKNLLTSAPSSSSTEQEKGERQLSTIDYLSNLQQSQNNNTSMEKVKMGRGRYKTRLKSGKNDPVRYKDLVGANENYMDEEVDEALKECTEDPYIPDVDPYETEGDGTKIEKKSRGKQIGPKCSKVKGGKSDSDGYSEREIDAEPPLSGMWGGNYFRCSICTRIFANKALRDQHEERERLSLKVHQCPICDGFFGSEETKSKHMEERHNVQTLSVEQQEQYVNQLSQTNKEQDKSMRRKPIRTTRNRTEYKNTTNYDSESSYSRPVREGEGEHIEIKTEDEEESDLKCSFCEMSFDSEEEKQEHLVSFHGVES